MRFFLLYIIKEINDGVEKSNKTFAKVFSKAFFAKKTYNLLNLISNSGKKHQRYGLIKRGRGLPSSKMGNYRQISEKSTSETPLCDHTR